MATWSVASSSPSNKPTVSQILRCRLRLCLCDILTERQSLAPWGWYIIRPLSFRVAVFLGCLAESASASGTREAHMEQTSAAGTHEAIMECRAAPYPYSKMCELCELCELFVKTEKALLHCLMLCSMLATVYFLRKVSMFSGRVAR